MILAAAMVLDAVFGEPDWLWSRLPHPAVVLGRLVGRLEHSLNMGDNRRAKGVLAVAILLSLSWTVGGLIAWVPDAGLLEMLGAAILLAQRSLVTHVRAVADALRRGGATAGRLAVAMIVGRDTAQMDAPQIARAAIESGAENLSDGVIAPAFWFAIGGLPAMLAYKAVNTADSMIGYRTERYLEFGWAAARLDDALNWVPARLTAGLILLPHGAVGLWHRVPNDARLHRSPNAGWPEAAIAPVLDVALSGPRSYDGRLQEFPWVNPTGRREAGPDDIDRACTALWKTWAAALALVLVLTFLFF
ncbi:cobalamin biosynthesis protein CobD [Jannaschia pagri]|uniref:Cobalamin biosynthesis protein CobD n=1 Tax=Jannaschia pagri TaxID=2829797 RepID=A0ABQ4NID2_9RHOB|nr:MULTISPECIES: adenosylcobinamide-phosphate synthase CbiB [unclassified Jannaschia]GIT89827.1 cobalamin biosynthesis protein CobD [Jannaschia sp. AI_61]GIT94066.1 cobalamin biosynthesis protein CobD [Jannaschia sp. AI_62]